MNYYERHLGDYARDTAHLSMLEHGAYNLLLDRYYASEAPIPADQAHRVARARSAEERKAVDAVLAEFFTLEEGGFRQKRVQAEIERAHHRIETARSNGRTGGRPKKNPAGFGSHIPKQTENKPNGFPVGSKTETGLKALQTPDSRLQSPDQNLPTVDSGDEKPKETQRVSVSRGTSEFQADYDWAMAVLRPLYPKPATDREWQFTARQIAALLAQGETRERLQQLAQDFLAQKQAENAGSQFIESPQKHYHTTEGKWGGPFALPTPAGRKTSVAARTTWHPDNDATGTA